MSNDFTLRYENRWYQITRNNRSLPKPRFRVTVRTLLDGTVELGLGGRRLDCVEIPIPKPAVVAQSNTAKPRPRPKPYKPGPHHPWRTRSRHIGTAATT